jgi:hypothetical protein
MRHLVVLPIVGLLVVFGSVREAKPASAPLASAPLAGACVVGTVPAANATYASDHPAIVTLIPGGFALQKTCDAFATYGGYDVAYTGQTATWSFTVPPIRYRSARVLLTMNADDHGTPISAYHYRVWLGTCGYDDPTPLPHGSPAGTSFGNWVQVAIPLPSSPGSTFTVSLTNMATNALGPVDWIAVRSIELELVP